MPCARFGAHAAGAGGMRWGLDVHARRSFVPKPEEMISEASSWPPPRVQLKVLTLRPLSLFQLPARGEERPWLEGKRERADITTR